MATFSLVVIQYESLSPLSTHIPILLWRTCFIVGLEYPTPSRVIRFKKFSLQLHSPEKGPQTKAGGVVCGWQLVGTGYWVVESREWGVSIHLTAAKQKAYNVMPAAATTHEKNNNKVEADHRRQKRVEVLVEKKELGLGYRLRS